MEKLKNIILSNNITLVETTPNVRSLLIMNLLNELSIKDKYKTLLYSFNIRSEYYFRKLITFLSGINSRLVTEYFYPYVKLSKNNVESINRDNFVDAIEKIKNSNILMSSDKYFSDKDYVDYILDTNENDVLIIDDFYKLLDKSKYDLEEIIKKLKRKKTIHFVLLMNKTQNEVIKEMEKYIKNFVLVEGCNYSDYKDIYMRYFKEKVIEEEKLKFNKNNQMIME